MRKLKHLWQLIKGIFKDRTPYIVVFDSNGRTNLAFIGSVAYGADESSVFVGDWDGAYRFMQSRKSDSKRSYRIAIAGDVPELAHFFPQYK